MSSSRSVLKEAWRRAAELRRDGLVGWFWLNFRQSREAIMPSDGRPYLPTCKPKNCCKRAPARKQQNSINSKAIPNAIALYGPNFLVCTYLFGFNASITMQI